jgi:acid phosphatase type 7
MTPTRIPLSALVVSALLVLTTACSGTPSQLPSPSSASQPVAASASASPPAAPPATASTTPSGSLAASPAATPAVVLAVGDIAACGIETDERVAEIVAAEEGTLLTLGDHAYDNATAEEFEECYDPAWGEFRERTRPTIGNHEYHTDRGAPYWEYFGDAAGTPGEGWYSFDLGGWHIVALNSVCEVVDCDADSPQGEWLAQDLAESDASCTLAFWHFPRYSSGPEGGTSAMAELWEMLDREGAEVVLSGHAHIYERLVPLDGGGYDDPDGIRQFIVGTGGRSLYQFGDIEPASAARTNEVYGVLKLTLHPESYDWEFLPVGETDFSDSGSAECS